MEMAYKITEVCGDWALHLPPYGKTDAGMILIFNSRNNAELVKSVLEWEDAHPNAAIPYKSTLTPPNEPLTLDELREMVGCWVWVIVTYQHEGKTFQCDGWALVETPARIAYLDQEFQLTELGTRFHAYRHQVSDFRVRVAPNDL